jgi:hypothetical protein
MVETAQITAYSLLGKRPINITVNNPIPFRGGGSHEKFMVAATVESARRSVPLIERKPQSYEGETEDIVRNWLLFRDAKLRVVPTLRKTSRGTLLETDIKAGGAEIYGKALYNSLIGISAPDGRVRSRPMIDERFLELTSSEHFDKIEAEAQKSLQIAQKNNILLPVDDPLELVVEPDGSFYLITLDLAFATRVSQWDKGNINLHLRIVNDFLKNLKAIRRKLLDTDVT